MDTTLLTSTTSTAMTVAQWAFSLQNQVLENPTTALDAANAAKWNAESGEDEENKTRQFENTLLALVAAGAIREGFDDGQVVAIVNHLAAARGHYGYLASQIALAAR